MQSDKEDTNYEENTGIYSEEGREELREDDDSISNVDEGFMQGYEEEEKMAKCGSCGEILEDKIIEKEFDGEIYRFCSRECVEKFEKARKE